MLFRSRKTKPKTLSLYTEKSLIYRGPVEEMPLDEPLILESSIRFFNDSNPCEIHRSAVRLRLTKELEEKLLSADYSAAQQLAFIHTLTGNTSIDCFTYAED